jgi:hypothetical protein
MIGSLNQFAFREIRQRRRERLIMVADGRSGLRAWRRCATDYPLRQPASISAALRANVDTLAKHRAAKIAGSKAEFPVESLMAEFSTGRIKE